MTCDVFGIIMAVRNKSSDVNVFPVRVLKHVARLISPVLAFLINESFSIGVFPDSSKIGKVVPVFTDGGCTQLSNYPPISILLKDCL